MKLFYFLVIFASGFLNVRGQESIGIKLQSGDYIMFWSCGGAAKHKLFPVYCLSSNGLNADTSHNECFHPKSLAELEMVPCSDVDFKKALNIPLSLPPEILAKESGTWGKRATDASTTYVVAHLGDKVYKWQFKADVDQCSKYVQDFVYHVISFKKW